MFTNIEVEVLKKYSAFAYLMTWKEAEEEKEEIKKVVMEKFNSYQDDSDDQFEAFLVKNQRILLDKKNQDMYLMDSLTENVYNLMKDNDYLISFADIKEKMKIYPEKRIKSAYDKLTHLISCKLA